MTFGLGVVFGILGTMAFEFLIVMRKFTDFQRGDEDGEN